MSRAEARREVIQALAELRKRDPTEIEAAALAAGEECPYESQWLVKAGVRAARRLDLKLAPKAGDAKAFKSIDALAAYIEQLPPRQKAA
jgi:hypothetical protein